VRAGLEALIAREVGKTPRRTWRHTTQNIEHSATAAGVIVARRHFRLD